MEGQLETETPSKLVPGPPTGDEEISPFQLSITENKMEASLLVECPGDLSRDEAAEKINKLLAQKGVVFGIDQPVIDQCLNELPLAGEKSYVIAHGNPPSSGQDAAILLKTVGEKKVGTLDQYATMDFRDRGRIFQVNEGDLLAVKVPMVEGEEGKAVTGEAIPAPPVHDVPFRVGRNVDIAGDRAEAKVSGIVLINSQQEIEVSPVYIVDGNVDLGVGHLDFDGLVQISGNILSGFRVRAGCLLAGFVEQNTKIEVNGDMTVREGLVGSEVKVSGLLKCAYVKGTRITAEGDVIVEAEIVDSHISSLGKVVVTKTNGRIINSTIISKMGIETYNFGSPASPACVAVLGHDHRSDTKIRSLNEDIRQCEEVLKKLENKFKEILDGRNRVEKEAEKIKKSLPSSTDMRHKYRLHVQYKDLSAQHKELTKYCSSLSDAIASQGGHKKELETEREQLMAECARINPNVYLNVRGGLFEGTIIRGKNVRSKTRETIRSVRAHEISACEEQEDGTQKEVLKIELLAL